MCTQEQAAGIERKTRYQSKYLSRYEEHRCRITSSFFGRVGRRLSSTSLDSPVNSIWISICPNRCHCPVPGAWGKDNEDRALSPYRQEWHERGHSSLEVTMSGLVINPEYSWFGASLDGIVQDPGCTDPNGLLEIKFPYNYHDLTLFPQKGFRCWLEKDKLVLNNNTIIIIKWRTDSDLL